MVGIASSRFRISAHDAEDLAQSAFVTFLEVRERYAAPEEYPAILVGILRNKCFEHLRRSSSEHRKLRRYCASPDASRENPWISHATCAEAPSVLDELERREQDNEIRRSLERLSAPSGQIVSLISKRGFGRRELIAHFGVNPNTFDTRLRSCRCELRVLLAKSGIAS